VSQALGICLGLGASSRVRGLREGGGLPFAVAVLAYLAANALILNSVLLGHRPTVIELSALPGDLLGKGGHLGEESSAAYRVRGRRRVAGQLVILGGYVDHHSFGALPGPPPPKLVRPRKVAGGPQQRRNEKAGFGVPLPTTSRPATMKITIYGWNISLLGAAEDSRTGSSSPTDDNGAPRLPRCRQQLGVSGPG
jgi:hypothetical protein